MKHIVLFLGLLAVLAVAGCDRQPAAPPPSSTPAASEDPAAPTPGATMADEFAGEWTLARLGDTLIHGGFEIPSLTVEPEGAVSGFAGVNRFTGGLAPAQATLFGPLATTRRAGPPAAMELETRYLAALQQATGWRRQGDELVLTDDGGELAAFRLATD